MRMYRLRPACAVLLLALTGCPEQTAVWIGEGSSARDLTLVFGRERGEEERISAHVQIDRCEDRDRSPSDDRLVWAFQVDTSRVTYGQTGPGIMDASPARPLTAGCYYVGVSGTGHVAFAVDSLGRVAELDSVPPLPTGR